VLVEYFDTSFRNVTDVESKLNLPVLGVIPFAREPARRHEAGSSEAEPFRVLQTNLNLALKAGQPVALVVLSAGPGEGKSTIVRQLALAMAAAGERVLLVDSDVRRPTQHRLANLPRTPGLTDVLVNKHAWPDAVRRDAVAGFDFIASGSTGDITLSLLYAQRLRDFVAEFKQRYDKILFDSPPVIGVSDASVLASVSDGAVLLVQHRRNPQSMVRRACQIVEGLKVPVLGVILNQVPSNSGEDYGYYTSNYSYYRHRDESEPAKGAAGRGSRRAAERLDLKEKDRGTG
jgi:capsular exopolysaccharide synthesis family protein